MPSLACPLPSPFSRSPAVTADPVTDRTPIAAQCVAATSPAAARPFETVYVTPNDAIYSAMLVASPRQGEICIVQATDRPVSRGWHAEDA